MRLIYTQSYPLVNINIPVKIAYEIWKGVNEKLTILLKVISEFIYESEFSTVPSYCYTPSMGHPVEVRGGGGVLFSIST